MIRRLLAATALLLLAWLAGAACPPAGAFEFFERFSRGGKPAAEPGKSDTAVPPPAETDRPAAPAGETQKLEWNDLVPKGAALENPVDKLRPDQLPAFYAAEYWRSYYPKGMAVDPSMAADMANARKDALVAEKKLTKQGVDVEDLFARYFAWQDEVEKRGRTTVDTLDGRQVAIAGYLLPLDFNEAGVREFLLVPFVGACIHVPPPPPNQVVFVKTAKSHKVAELFDGVTVSGRLKVGQVAKNLSLVDGAGDVSAGYTLQDGAIDTLAEPQGGK